MAYITSPNSLHSYSMAGNWS